MTFQSCDSLITLTVPDSVTSIGGSAFKSCGYLTSVTIGSGVTSIGANAFYYCAKLTSITITATNPPTLDSNTFNSTMDFSIYVPASSVDAYKAATNWSAYADKIFAIQD